MPTIPIQQTGISLDVGGADLNTGQQGIVGTALAQAGQQAVQVGFDAFDEMVKMEATEANNAKMAELSVRSLQKKKELEIQSVGGYMVDQTGAFIKNPGTEANRTITEEFRDWSNEEYRRGQAEMPNRLGQRMFQQQGLSALTDEIKSVYSTELVKRADYRTEQRKQWQTLTGNSIETDPQIEHAHEQMGALALRLSDDVAANGLNRNRVAEELRVVSNDYAMKFFTGHINKIKLGETVASVKGIVDGKETDIAKGPIGAIDDLLAILTRKKRTPGIPSVIDPQDEIGRAAKDYSLPSVDKALHPEPRDVFIDQLLAMRKSYTQKSSSDFSFKVDDIAKAAERGRFAPQESLVLLRAQAAQEIANGEPAQKIVGMLSKVRVGEALGRLLPIYTGDANPFGQPSTKEQVRRLKKEEELIRAGAKRDALEFNDGSVDPETVGGSEVAELNDKLNAAIAKNQSEFHAAPITFLTKSDPEAKRTFEQVDFSDRRNFTPENATKVQKILTRFDSAIQARARSGERTVNEVMPEGFTSTMSSIKTKMTDSMQGVDEGIAYMDGLRSLLGDKHYAKTIDRLSSQDKAMEDFTLVQYMNTPTEKRAALKLAWNGDKLRAGLVKEQGETAWTDVVQAVAAKTQKITASLFKHDADNTVDQNKQDAFNRVLSYQAAELVRSGKASTNQAAQTVYDQFIGRHFEVMAIGGAFFGRANGSKSEIVIPKYLPDGSPLTEGDMAKLQDYGDRPLADEMAGLKIKMPGENEMQQITPEHFKETLTKSNYVARTFGRDPNGSGELGWSLRYILRGKSGNEVSRIPLRLDTGKPSVTQEKVYFVPVRRSISGINK